VSRAPRLGLAALVWLVAAAPLAAQQAAAGDTLSLSLGDAARLAAAQSPQSAVARLSADAAAARVRASRADLYPSIKATGFEGSHTLNSSSFGIDFPAQPGQPPLFDPNGQIIGPVPTPDFRLAASLTLVDVAARRRVGSAQAAAEAENANAAVATDAAAASAALAYVTAQRADALVEARTADSSLAAELLGIARQQLDAGVSIALDVTRAEAQLADARAELVSARRDRDLAQLVLRRRLGVSLDAAIKLTDRLDVPQLAGGPPVDSAVAMALAARSDVAAARAAATASRVRLGAARAEVLPTLSVFGDEGYTGKSYNYLLRTYDWGIELSWPVFDGFLRTAHTSEDAALVHEAQVREADVRTEAAEEVRGALLDLASSREGVDAAREQLRLGERELSEARERFTTGVAGNTDVVLAASSLNRARTGLVDALAAYHTARVELARAEGAIRSLP